MSALSRNVNNPTVILDRANELIGKAAQSSMSQNNKRRSARKGASSASATLGCAPERFYGLGELCMDSRWLTTEAIGQAVCNPKRRFAAEVPRKIREAIKAAETELKRVRNCEESGFKFADLDAVHTEKAFRLIKSYLVNEGLRLSLVEKACAGDFSGLIADLRRRREKHREERRKNVHAELDRLLKKHSRSETGN